MLAVVVDLQADGVLGLVGFAERHPAAHFLADGRHDAIDADGLADKFFRRLEQRLERRRFGQRDALAELFIFLATGPAPPPPVPTTATATSAPRSITESIRSS